MIYSPYLSIFPSYVSHVSKEKKNMLNKLPRFFWWNKKGDSFELVGGFNPSEKISVKLDMFSK